MIEVSSPPEYASTTFLTVFLVLPSAIGKLLQWEIAADYRAKDQPRKARPR
jgi:hypothetical protein